MCRIEGGTNVTNQFAFMLHCRWQYREVARVVRLDYIHETKLISKDRSYHFLFLSVPIICPNEGSVYCCRMTAGSVPQDWRTFQEPNSGTSKGKREKWECTVPWKEGPPALSLGTLHLKVVINFVAAVMVRYSVQKKDESHVMSQAEANMWHTCYTSVSVCSWNSQKPSGRWKMGTGTA